MTELDLIKLAQMGDRKAENQLCKMHTGFIKLVASKYHIAGLDYDDIVQLCYDGLCKAIKDYDLNSGIKLISYSIYKIRGIVSRQAGELNRVKRTATICSLDAGFETVHEGDDVGFSLINLLQANHEFYSDDSFTMFEKCIELADIPELKKKVMRELFKNIKHELGFGFRDVAQKVGLTHQRVQQILKEMRNNVQFRKLHRQLKEMVEA